LDVELYIFTVAGIFPRIFAMFHYSSSAHLFGVFAFKAIEETYVWFWGEVSESELSS
jgi:hypothetical protein